VRQVKLIFCAILSLAATLAWTQEDTIPKKRLHIPAVATGFVGGESHDTYVIHAQKGSAVSIVSIDISWQRSEDNQAQFTVSESPNFFNSAPVIFGSESRQGRHWSGQVPAAGDYYIYVVAHPSAHYTLRVALK
jgi:hypothetical protein